MSALELSFIYAYPLDGRLRSECQEKGFDNYPTIEEVQETVTEWQCFWTECDDKYGIIQTVSNLAKRTPQRSLECFVFGAGLNAMSTPFIMPIKRNDGTTISKEMFIQTVIHELLHIFTTTNTQNYWKLVAEKFAVEDRKCQNHIIVYAMLYEIYQNLFDKEPIDFSRNNLPPAYARAVSLVREIGYKELVQEYQSMV